MKWCMIATTAVSLLFAAGAYAQDDDLDLDALLGGDDAAAGLDEFGSDAGAAADDFDMGLDDLGADFGDAAETVEAAADDASDAFGDLADDTADAFDGLADDTADAAEEIDDSLGAFADDVADAAGDDDFFGGLDAAPAEPEAASEDDFFSAAAPAADEADDDIASSWEAEDEDFAPVSSSFDMDEESDEAPAISTRGAKLADRIPAKEAKAQAKALARLEEGRRQAAEADALAAAKRGYDALNAKNPALAETEFTTALQQFPARAGMSEEIRANLARCLAEAKCQRAAKMMESEEMLPEARRLVDEGLAVDPKHTGLIRLNKKLAKLEERAERPKPPAKQAGTLAKADELGQLYTEAKQWYFLKDYDRSEALFRKILAIDPYHKSALRYIKKIEERKMKVATLHREATVQERMTQVRDTWNIPARAAIAMPEEGIVQEAKVVNPRSTALQEKMQSIIIPKVEFRQAQIADVVSYLVDASINADPSGEGINIILNLGDGGAAMASTPAPAAAADDEWGGFGDDDGFGAPAASSFGGGSSSVPPITLNLRNVTMTDAVRFITEVARLKYRVEETAVIITPKDAPLGNIITRMYPVQPSFIDVVIERQAATAEDHDQEFVGMNRTTFQKGDVREFFEKTGVQFPAGASITYNAAISQLIVANTAENLETFERILQQINIVPNQVEIEARFVEVNQNDLEELGLQWILNDNWEIANKKDGSGGRIQMNAGNTTKGLRFFGYNSSTLSTEAVNLVTQTENQALLGGIASFASVLTNPELGVVIQALSQHGGTDLLSAPRVTTRSGVNAQIQVVREIIYPTEFDLTQPTVDGDGNVTMAPVVTPGGFETRETGVILNVTPTVGPDGYTIDLVMAPEVCELVDWIQYGSVIKINSAEGESNTYTLNMPQPVFTSRNVTTSIVIWDGQTVVMGGLIREELTTIKDKVPILGDIPILGWLFRSEGQYSEKKNLLIFVTARLVDPAGRPVHADGAMMPGVGLSTSTAD